MRVFSMWKEQITISDYGQVKTCSFNRNLGRYGIILVTIMHCPTHSDPSSLSYSKECRRIVNKSSGAIGRVLEHPKITRNNTSQSLMLIRSHCKLQGSSGAAQETCVVIMR